MTTEKIILYHTNDLHSHLEYWPRIVKELRTKRRKHEEAGDEVFVFDIGDACDRVHPLTEATEGQAITRLLNDAGYDAVTIGNNEGIGSTKEQLNHLYDDADYTVLLSNLFDRNSGEAPSWAKKIKIYTTNTGFRIGVFACTIPLLVSYGPLGWNVTDPFEATADMLDTFAADVDCWIMLSHLGLNIDRELAERFPIDIIMGGHTHHALPEGERINGTLITGAGRFGEWIGEIELDVQSKKIQRANVTLKNVEKEVDSVAGETALVLKYQQVGHQLLQKQAVAKIPQTWQVDWKGPSKFVDIGLDAIADFAGTDAAILNAGLFLQPLIEGIVTRDELHQTLPHPMRVLKCKLTGSKFIKLIQSMEEQRATLRSLPIKGLGFRGEIFGEICYKGITFNENGEVLWNGEKIDTEKEYIFASVDHFLYVPFFPIMSTSENIEVLFPYFLRKVVGDYLGKHYPLE